jgi:hypothetical protein
MPPHSTRQSYLDAVLDGFNANMAKLFVEMTPKKSPVEFSIIWSPRVEPPDDLATVTSIRLGSQEYDYLERASEELRHKEPERITIRGTVKGLTASDAPLKTSSNRLIVIQAILPTTRRVGNVIVELTPDEYVRADRANIAWDTVPVTGILTRSGNNWRLLAPGDFRILE